MTRPASLLAAVGRGYLTYHEYNAFLAEAFAGPCFADFPELRVYAEKLLDDWRVTYIQKRLYECGEEMLAPYRTVPHIVHLHTAVALRGFALALVEHAALAGDFFGGVVVPDDLVLSEEERRSAGVPIRPLSEVLPAPDRIVLTLDATNPCPEAAHSVANDMIERFVDLRPILAFKARCAGERLAIIPNIFNRQQYGALANHIRHEGELSTVLLVPNDLPQDDPQYTYTLARQSGFLWPLILTLLAPDIIHLNVGTGEFGLQFVPFAPPERTVIDFYDLVVFTPDTFLSETGYQPDLLRATYAYYFKNYPSIVHRCDPDISRRLVEHYGTPARVVSILEFVQEPTFASERKPDGSLRLAFGGEGIIATNDPSDRNYAMLLEAGQRFCRGNVHLELYPQPFILGFQRSLALDAFIEEHGFANMHGHRPRSETDFIEAISAFDYAVFPFSMKVMGSTAYNYAMPYKLTAFLRAGLPIVVRSHHGMLADMVQRHGIGVVLPDESEADFDRWVEILNAHEVRALKANVLEFRETFRVEHGARKLWELFVDRCPALRPAYPPEVQRRMQVQLLAHQQAQVLVAQGEECYHSGDLSGAGTAFQQALRYQPRSTTILNNLAVVDWQMGDTRQALAYLLAALDIAPFERNTVMNCGELLVLLGEVEAARNVYEGFLSLHPEDKGIVQQLADLA